MPTKSISTQQAATPITGATLLAISPAQCVIYDIEGDVNSTTGSAYYIQLLGTASPVSGTTKPLWSRECVAAAAASGVNAFSFVYNPVGIDTATMNYPEGATTGGSNTSPVYLAISSTDTVWTSVAASTNAQVTIEDTYEELAAQTIVGDTTTGVDALTVWSAVTIPPHRLIQIAVSNSTAALTSGTLVAGQTYKIGTYVAGDDFTNVGGANYSGAIFIATGTTPNVWAYSSSLNQGLFLMLFANSPNSGQFPLQQFVVFGTALTFFRFNPGLVIQGVGSPVNSPVPNDYNYHTGCYLAGSSKTQYLTATTGTNWTMKAWYL